MDCEIGTKTSDERSLLPRLRGSCREATEGALSTRAAPADRARPPSHAARDSSPASGGAEELIPRAAVVAAARSWLGTPYLHQASAKGRGSDCLGLIIGLYTELLGRSPEAPPPYTPDWNERRPCDEPLLSAARRHLVEADFFSPLSLWERGRGEGSAGPAEDLRARQRDPLPRPLPQRGRGEVLLPGQVLIFRIVPTGPAKHCGVVSTDDQFIHAYAGRAVIESWLCRWWTERVAGVFEFPGVASWPS